MQQVNNAVRSTSNIPSKVTPVFNSNLNVEPLYYTVKQAALIMGFDPGTLRNWISLSEQNKGKRCPFTTVKRGGKRLILITSFNEYLARCNDENFITHDADIKAKPRRRGRPRNTNQSQIAKNN